MLPLHVVEGRTRGPFRLCLSAEPQANGHGANVHAVGLHPQLAIRPAQLDAFMVDVNDIVEAARRLDTGTLRFDLYLSEDGSRCEVHEVYESAAAFFEHGQHVVQPGAKLFADCGEPNRHQVTAFGEVPQQIVDMANAHGIGRYTFRQGLQVAPVA